MTPYQRRLSPLTQRMAEDMLVRNFSQNTIDAYTYHVGRFVDFAGQPAEELGPEQIRQYQLHLIREKKVGWSSFNQKKNRTSYRLASEQRREPAETYFACR